MAASSRTWLVRSALAAGAALLAGCGSATDAGVARDSLVAGTRGSVATGPTELPIDRALAAGPVHDRLNSPFVWYATGDGKIAVLDLRSDKEEVVALAGTVVGVDQSGTSDYLATTVDDGELSVVIFGPNTPQRVLATEVAATPVTRATALVISDRMYVLEQHPSGSAASFGTLTSFSEGQPTGSVTADFGLLSVLSDQLTIIGGASGGRIWGVPLTPSGDVSQEGALIFDPYAQSDWTAVFDGLLDSEHAVFSDITNPTRLRLVSTADGTVTTVGWSEGSSTEGSAFRPVVGSNSGDGALLFGELSGDVVYIGQDGLAAVRAHIPLETGEGIWLAWQAGDGYGALVSTTRCPDGSDSCDSTLRYERI